MRGVPGSKRPDEARVAMVFQDSAVALNPLVRMREQIIEPLRRHQGLSRAAASEAAVELAGSVGLSDAATLLHRFPAEISGGQRQRVCIAVALACNTNLMVADEPTTALDVVTQKRVLDVLKKYTAGAKSPGLLFITHDFAVASELCSQAIVMRDGDVIESGQIHTIFAKPEASYTRSLIRAARAATVDPYVQKFRNELAGAAQESPDGDLLTTKKVFYDIGGVSRQYRLPRRGLFKRSAVKTALSPTSMNMRAGERTGIVGVSGSGKTTLLKLMLALESSDTGVVSCQGREVFPAEVSKLKWYRRKVQYVPQDPASTLDPLMTVRKLVKEPLIRLGVPGDHEAMVRDALQSVNLDEKFLHRRANELSGGQAQRLAIARSIATKPDYLLADEPVSGLDLPMREQIVGLLREISQTRGTGIVVVSHDLSMVASLCERTIVMHASEVIEDRPTKELLTDPQHRRTRELLDAIPTLHVLPEGMEAVA